MNQRELSLCLRILDASIVVGLYRDDAEAEPEASDDDARVEDPEAEGKFALVHRCSVRRWAS